VSHATTPTGYEFSTDFSRIDADRVHELLSSHAPWAAGRPRSVQDAAVAGSRNYGIYETAGNTQVAYARVVTDLATFAWLADVVVAPDHRGRGLARALVAGIMTDLEPFALRRIVLKASAEGRPIYVRSGWAPVDEPDDWMVLYPQGNRQSERPGDR
jgi:GNAT superfamily N-acetyltransferase